MQGSIVTRHDALDVRDRTGSVLGEVLVTVLGDEDQGAYSFGSTVKTIPGSSGVE